MEESLMALIIVACAIVPFVNALVGAVKLSFPNINARLMPSISIISGGVVGFLFSFLPQVNYGHAILILSGVIAGLAACGVYDLSKLGKSTKQ